MGGLNGYARRVDALEELVRASDPEVTPEQLAAQERLERLCCELQATMDPEHAAGVARVWIGWARDELPTEGRWVHLAQIAQHMVGWAFHGDDSFRLALPPAAAEVYLEHGVWPFDQCADCLLLLACAAGHWRGAGVGNAPTHVPAVRYFERCPDCGGEVRPRPIQVRRAS